MAKVGIGCGVLAIIGVVVLVLLVGWCQKKVGEITKDFSDNPERTAAEMVVKLNPDLELVNTDDEAETITFRDKTGKETTIAWSELKDGKLTISDSEGTRMTLGGSDMSTVPEWVPRLPETTRVVSSHQSVERGKTQGSYMVSSPMDTAAIERFLAEQASALAMEVATDNRHSANNQEMRMIAYKGEGRGFSATIIREAGGEAQVQFIYEEEEAGGR